MKRRVENYVRNDYGQKISNPDVRPLDQRKNKLDTRKGMQRVRETVNVRFLEHQTKIDEFENQI